MVANYFFVQFLLCAVVGKSRRFVFGVYSKNKLGLSDGGKTPSKEEAMRLYRMMEGFDEDTPPDELSANRLNNESVKLLEDR